MSQKYRVRMTDALAARVVALAAGWGLPISTLMRLAILDLVRNPERIPELMLQPYGPEQQNTSTPEQTAAAQAYLDRIGKCIFPVPEVPVTQGSASRERVPR
jgi:hypothetical protein